MPYPQEYQIADQLFYDFLKGVKEEAMFNSTHMTYSMVQGVLCVFRQRLSLEQAIAFSNALPAPIRAFFVADWDTSLPRKPFGPRKEMNREVQELRSDHNFSFLCDDAISVVAKALRQVVDQKKLDTVLTQLGPEAVQFWET